MKNVKLGIILLIILIGCKEEKEPEYPMVQTGNVIEIESSGVVFNGKIMNQGSNMIMDYGFVWDTIELPNIETSYIRSFGEATSSLFSCEISSALIQRKKYYVRAFIKTDIHTAYGRSISFVSLGSSIPKITDLFPEVATWGDTLFIKGENFSLRKGENQVNILEYIAEITQESDSLISVIIPNQLDTTPVDIKVSFLNDEVISIKKFNLTPPIISDFNPKNGTYSTNVKIIGNYFSEGKTKVYFGNKEAEISSVNDSIVRVSVPNGLPDGNVDLSVIVAYQEAIAGIKFQNVSPVITNIIPNTSTWNNVIMIEGRNFSDNINDVKVKFDSINATVLEVNSSKIWVLVPVPLILEKSHIIVTIDGKLSQPSEEFTLLNPIIESLEPSIGVFGDVVTIKGENFNPIISNNRVLFGDTIAEIVNFNQNEIKVKVPNNYFSLNGENKIAIAIGDLYGISNNDFELLPHSISSFDPKEGDRNDDVTIYGENFNPVLELNHVFFNEIETIVKSGDRSELIVLIPDGVIHGNQEIKVEVAGREVIASEIFMVYEPWSKIADFPEGPRLYSISFAINNRAFVGGGIDSSVSIHSDFWEYIPSSNTWIEKDNFPFRFDNSFCFSTNTKGYVLVLKHLWQYNPETDQWIEKAEFPGEGRYAQSGFSIENKGYVGTGKKTLNSISEFWEYNEETDIWTQKADYAGEKIAYGVGFSIGDKGYITASSSKNLYEYNPVTDSWTNKLTLLGIVEDITDSRYLATAFSLNGKGYFTTGRKVNFGRVYKDIYEYDPVNNSLIRLVDLPSYIRYGAVSFTIYNKSYIGLGTKMEYAEILEDFWEFNPERIKR